MHTKEVLSIVALGALGLCLLMGLGKMAMKNPAKKAQMDKACGFLVFVAAALVGVTQVLKIGGGKPSVPWTPLTPASHCTGCCSAGVGYPDCRIAANQTKAACDALPGKCNWMPPPGSLGGSCKVDAYGDPPSCNAGLTCSAKGICEQMYSCKVVAGTSKPQCVPDPLGQLSEDQCPCGLCVGTNKISTPACKDILSCSDAKDSSACTAETHGCCQWLS